MRCWLSCNEDKITEVLIASDEDPLFLRRKREDLRVGHRAMLIANPQYVV